MSRERAYGCIAATILAWTTGSATARAQVQLMLTHGGLIQAQSLETTNEGTAYRIQTSSGDWLVIDKEAVRDIVKPHAAEVAYERLMEQAIDSVNWHWEAAQWCREQGLDDLRTAHLERIVELDPEHVEARRLLGYKMVHGEWTKREDLMIARGFVRYRGHWRTTQEIMLLQERERLERRNAELRQQLHRWRQELYSEQGAQAQVKIANLRDPLAVPILGEYLYQERDRRAKLLYIHALSQIANQSAIAILIQTTLREQDAEVFYACLDRIRPLKTPAVTRQYVKALKSDNNQQINRAAMALAELKDPTAIMPLIDALVTVHAVPLNPRGGTETTFVRSSPSVQGGEIGGDSFSSSPSLDVIQVRVRNQEVLGALAQLTGVSYGFNRQSWINWHAAAKRQQEPAIGARRDQ